jgi:hypothetical protein
MLWNLEFSEKTTPKYLSGEAGKRGELIHRSSTNGKISAEDAGACLFKRALESCGTE